MRLTLRRHYSEEQLIEACRAGRAAAQRVCYERYAPTMYTVCLRYLRDEFAAEEALAKGFIKVFEKIGQLREGGSLEGWMRRIMMNEALGHLRREKLRFAQTDLAVAERAAPEALPYAEEALAAEELLALVQELPDGFRTVFNLYAIEGYTHPEIAEMLSISVGTSKSQLSRARQWLQQRLAHLYDEAKKNCEYA